MNERRRNVLRTAGVALAAGLAGCQQGTDGDDTETETATQTETETATRTPTATETATRTQTQTQTPTATGTGDGTQTPTETATRTQTETPTETGSGVSLVVDNVGASAWQVLEDSSGSVAVVGTENPTMTFEVGRRYEVENRGWDVHPFALRAADDSPLLSQSADGSFEGDSGVDWVDDGGSFAFTMTEGLSAEVDYYICTVHPSMRGPVETA